jgi:hypothetical protein
MAEAKRVEIGFEGGQVTAVRLTQKQLDGLRKALDDGDGWHDLSSEDGDLAVDLRKVVFVKVEGGAHTIGFSGG